MSELLILTTGVAWVARSLAAGDATARARRTSGSTSGAAPLDLGVGAWLLLSVISLSWAVQRGAAVTELRALVLEPAVFFLILRASLREGSRWYG